MDHAFAAEEKVYWEGEARRRSVDVEAARMGGDAPHLLAGAELRLREATERLREMATRPDTGS